MGHPIFKEEFMMKEERMAVLGMLEKGIITVSEAERLLLILQNEEDERMKVDGVGATIGSAINKAGDVLSSFAKTVGETTEKVAEKVEPKIKKAASSFADKAATFAEEAKNYAERKRQEFSEAEEDCDCEEEMQDDDFEETQELLQKLKEEPEENLSEEEKRFRKKMTGYVDAVEFQNSQLDSEEALLKQMQELKESEKDAKEETDK